MEAGHAVLDVRVDVRRGDQRDAESAGLEPAQVALGAVEVRVDGRGDRDVEHRHGRRVVLDHPERDRQRALLAVLALERRAERLADADEAHVGALGHQGVELLQPRQDGVLVPGAAGPADDDALVGRARERVAGEVDAVAAHVDGLARLLVAAGEVVRGHDQAVACRHREVELAQHLGREVVLEVVVFLLAQRVQVVVGLEEHRDAGRLELADQLEPLRPAHLLEDDDVVLEEALDRHRLAAGLTGRHVQVVRLAERPDPVGAEVHGGQGAAVPADAGRALADEEDLGSAHPAVGTHCPRSVFWYLARRRSSAAFCQSSATLRARKTDS